jgi:hypothetical protein
MKNYTHEIKWALYFALMMLVWMVLERMAGLHDEHIDKHPLITNIVAIPAIAMYVFALRQKREKAYGGHMSYKQGFMSGLIMTLVITILSPLTQYITSTIITPDFFTHAINYAVAEGKMSQTKAEDYFSLTNYVKQTILFTPVMGIVTTAIVAIFVKRK